jgi:hypothetical protein
MAADYWIIAIGIFLTGTVAGVIAIIVVGIRREERHFREWRRFRQQQGTWDGPDGPEHFFPEVAPDRVSHGTRALNGLYVRRRFTGTDPAAVLLQDTRV